MRDLKEVRFDKWCSACTYGELEEKMDPCNECLEIGMREGTDKPDKFEEKE